MKRNEQEIARIKSDINSPKEKLIHFYFKLQEIGENKEAESLGRIIDRLEAWQNR